MARLNQGHLRISCTSYLDNYRLKSTTEGHKGVVKTCTKIFPTNYTKIYSLAFQVDIATNTQKTIVCENACV